MAADWGKHTGAFTFQSNKFLVCPPVYRIQASTLSNKKQLKTNLCSPRDNIQPYNPVISHPVSFCWQIRRVPGQSPCQEIFSTSLLSPLGCWIQQQAITGQGISLLLPTNPTTSLNIKHLFPRQPSTEHTHQLQTPLTFLDSYPWVCL